MQTAEGTAPKGSESTDTAKSEEVKEKPSATSADTTPKTPESKDTDKIEHHSQVITFMIMMFNYNS